MSVRAWQQRLYPDPLQRDPVARFNAVLEGEAGPTHTVLDIGAGAGEKNPYDVKSRVAKLVGIDMDPRVGRNPLLHAGLVADGTRLPFPDGTFDLAFSIYVLEHIADADGFAREIARVLKPGGRFLSLTPNRYHYASLIAALTPTRFHKWINRRRGRNDEDTFPTQYRLNSKRQLQSCFGRAGLKLVRFQLFEVQPNYLMFSTPSFLAGACYERVVNRFDFLAGLRVNIISTFRKG